MVDIKHPSCDKNITQLTFTNADNTTKLHLMLNSDTNNTFNTLVRAIHNIFESNNILFAHLSGINSDTFKLSIYSIIDNTIHSEIYIYKYNVWMLHIDIDSINNLFISRCNYIDYSSYDSKMIQIKSQYDPDPISLDRSRIYSRIIPISKTHGDLDPDTTDIVFIPSMISLLTYIDKIYEKYVIDLDAKLTRSPMILNHDNYGLGLSKILILDYKINKVLSASNYSIIKTILNQIVSFDPELSNFIENNQYIY